MADENNGQRKPRIKLRNIYKIFGKNPQRGVDLLQQGMSKDDLLNKSKLAVGCADVSFDIYEGETLVVMGLSGSGKSTLIRTVNRLMEPTAGQVIVDGTDVTKLNPEELRKFRQQKFSMVFQSFALFPHRTVLENVEFGLEIQGVNPEDRRPRAEDSLKTVGLEGWGEYYPTNLSGGMKQRVGLARALTTNTDVLLMDEAFSALDPLIRTDMQDELIALNDRVQKTIMFITHDLDEALKMGDRIVLMKDGAVVQIGTPEDILTNPANDYVERFVENVDITKVLTAQDVMKKPRPVALVKDGPRVALRKMKESGLSGIFVCRQSGELVGHLSAERAAEAAKKEDKWIETITDREHVASVPLDHPVRQLFALCSSGNPVAVVDDQNHLRGVVVRGSIIAALSEARVDVDEQESNTASNEPATTDEPKEANA